MKNLLQFGVLLTAKRMAAFYFSLLFVFMLTSASLFAQQVAPSIDLFIHAGQADLVQNTSNPQTLEVRNSVGIPRISFLEFALPDALTSVSKAELNIYLYNTDNAGTDAVNVHSLTSGSFSNSSTWNTMNPAGVANYALGPVLATSASITSAGGSAVAQNVWRTLDIKAFVNTTLGGVTGTNRTIKLALKGNALALAMRFYSKEAPTGFPVATGKTPFLDLVATSLPIELQSLKAKNNGASNLISWVTASEKGNASFSIESSSDGIHFTGIGTVKGSGTTNEERSYNFSDETPLSMSYYRLRQTDNNGETSVSKIVSVSREKGATARFYPSVTKDEVTIELPNDTPANISISNIMGQTVMTKTGMTGTSNLNINGLSAGTYFLTISQTGVTVTSKLLKQ
jgi:hypothetical protein